MNANLSRPDFFTRWLKFSKYNQFIDGIDIIPFKSPLRFMYEQYITDEEKFVFRDVYNYTTSVSKPITDVLDLTEAESFYDPLEGEFFPPTVLHHKIEIPGKTVPKKELLNEIHDKMERMINDKKVIGVHCLHGANRTGFVICSFLVNRMGWEPAVALAAFQKARGEEIGHQGYVDALMELKKEKNEM